MRLSNLPLVVYKSVKSFKDAERRDRARAARRPQIHGGAASVLAAVDVVTPLVAVMVKCSSRVIFGFCRAERSGRDRYQAASAVLESLHHQQQQQQDRLDEAAAAAGAERDAFDAFIQPERPFGPAGYKS